MRPSLSTASRRKQTSRGNASRRPKRLGDSTAGSLQRPPAKIEDWYEPPRWRKTGLRRGARKAVRGVGVEEHCCASAALRRCRHEWTTPLPRDRSLVEISLPFEPRKATVVAPRHAATVRDPRQKMQHSVDAVLHERIVEPFAVLGPHTFVGSAVHEKGRRRLAVHEPIRREVFLCVSFVIEIQGSCHSVTFGPRARSMCP